MVIARALSAQSVQCKLPGSAWMKQAVLKALPIGAGLTVQAIPALFVIQITFTIVLQKKPVKALVPSGAFHPRQTTAGVLQAARFAQTPRRGIVTLNRNAMVQTQSGVQTAAHQLQLFQVLPPLLIVQTIARHAPLKTRGTAATRTPVFQTVGIGAGLTAPKNNAPFVPRPRSGTVTRSKPARLSAAIGATLTALQASALFVMLQARAIVMARKHALVPAQNGAALIVQQVVHCAAILQRGIVTLKKTALMQVAIGAATIAPTSHARSAQRKIPGRAVARNHARVLAPTGASQHGRAEKAGALTIPAQPPHCTLFAETVYARPNLGKTV